MKHTSFFNDYDVIVVGAGHAGCEAAAAAARLNCSVLLITMDLSKPAMMSCNPSMGGVAKGQIVREIDALGGLSGIVTDHSMIQFRMLNRSKGPAMWSPRAQCDRMLFCYNWRKELEQIKNLDFWQDSVTEIILEKDTVCGVKTALGLVIKSKTVILSNGTFLNGTIHIGMKNFSGGRLGDMASFGLTENLKSLGFETSRLKTGTPVRVDGRTIDFSKMFEQKGDENPARFSFLNTQKITEQRSCWLSWTNERVHDVLRTGFDESPMFTGRIQGTGPRYCPSIEDKINRFSDKNRHQLFLEPEGWNIQEYYVNGFSSSLPEDIQVAALRLVSGFENVKILKPGYAIEYDYFSPLQLKNTLETKLIKNLYFAGQINGTTGYEEAASQGLIAGINAALQVQEKEPFVLKRSEAYIGVLIDDLITKGVDEPYRMFTSRAEYRILLRQDTADLRLTPRSFQLGLATEERMKRVEEKNEKSEKIIHFLHETKVTPNKINGFLESLNTTPISEKSSIVSLILRPQVNLDTIKKHLPDIENFLTSIDSDFEIEETAEIKIKYEYYINREQEMSDKLMKWENVKLPDDLDYLSIQTLSVEARQKLSKHRPQTLGQATRISGVSPADIQVLTIYFNKKKMFHVK